MKTISFLLLATLMIGWAAHGYSPQPEYTQWITEAKQAIQAVHPNASVIDFLYAGCRMRSLTSADYVYRYWLSGEDRQFAAFAVLRINKQTNQVVEKRVSEHHPWYDHSTRIAEETLRVEYPYDQIKDYRPKQCKAVTEKLAMQTFRFWMVKKGIVDVEVIHDMQTDKVVNIKLIPRTQPLESL